MSVYQSYLSSRTALKIFVAVSALMFSIPAIVMAEEIPTDFTTHTSNPVDSEDDRVAQLFSVVDGKEQSHLYCTAGHLSNGIWITASHCLDDFSNSEMILRQNDSEVAKVVKTERLSGDSDIVLLKAEAGITAGSFTLPSENLDVGDKATLVGYGGQTVPTYAEVVVTNQLDSFVGAGRRFEYVYQTAANEQHRACPGDSGGPVFVGDVIYAVHSGGEFTPVCSDKHGTLGFVAALYPKLDEIEAIVKDNDQQEAASLSGFSPSSSGTIGGLVNSLSSEKPLS